MSDVNPLPADRMTPEQRRHETGALLARGLARLRQGTPEPATSLAPESALALGFPGHQSVHSNPVNQNDTESR